MSAVSADAASAAPPEHEHKEIRYSLCRVLAAAGYGRSASPAGIVPGPPGWPVPDAPSLSARPYRCPDIG